MDPEAGAKMAVGPTPLSHLYPLSFLECVHVDLRQGHAAGACMGTVVPVTPGHVVQTEREALDGEEGKDSRVGWEALLQSVLKVKRLLPAMPQPRPSSTRDSSQLCVTGLPGLHIFPTSRF